MEHEEKYTYTVAQAIDGWKEKYDLKWMRPLSHEEFEMAKHEPMLTLSPVRKVPREWYRDLQGKKVLCLASGGGQQTAILSALGAECTLFDLSRTQIEADILVSKREGYTLHVTQGDMTERFPFADETFDLVINPVSNHYIEETEPVFREVYRVLKCGGEFLAGLDTGIYWAFDEESQKLAHPLPYNPLKDEQLRKELQDNDMGLIFSHTLEEQIGGQLRSGFTLLDLYEDTNGEGLWHEYHVPTFVVTRSRKVRT